LLNELRQLFPFFINLVCFSLYMKLRGGVVLELKPSDFSNLIEDHSATVRSSELDTDGRGFMQERTRRHHFCESIARRLHSLEHVRLAVTGLCDAILPAKRPKQSRLRRLVINFSNHVSPWSNDYLCQCQPVIFSGGTNSIMLAGVLTIVHSLGLIYLMRRLGDYGAIRCTVF
jgi:hypothetical protein